MTPRDPGSADRDGLIARMRAQGLTALAWSDEAGARYEPHRHAYDKVLVVADGSIRFRAIEHGTTADLTAGERLDLAAGTEHDALAGPDGVTCLEAHLAAGSLPHGATVRGRDW